MVLNAPVDNSSFYARHYCNKRKLIKKLGEQKVYNKDNVFPQVENILQNIYTYVNNTNAIDPFEIKALYTIFSVIEEKISNYIDPILDIFSKLLKTTDSGYSYQIIQYIFECLSFVIESIKADQNAQKKLIDTLLQLLNKLMNKGSNDLTSFLLQIYALLIKNFESMENSVKMTIFESLLNEKNYQQELVSLFPSYSLFFQEFINKNPQVAINYSNPLQGVSQKMLDYRTDNAFFSLYSVIFNS